MSELLRLRRLATLLLLAATAALAVLGARGFEQKLETFQPLGFQASPAGDHWEVRAVDPLFDSALEPGDRIVLVNGAEVSQVPRLAAALPVTREALDSGAARALLERWITTSQELQ